MIKKALFIIFLILLLTAPAYAQTSQPFALKDGFNFVSFTVNPTVTPAQLRSSYSSVSDIYLYNAAAGSFLSAAAGELTSLSAGKGYIIKSSGAASISVNGTSLSSVNVITLKTGFNLTGFSKMPETITFSQIMQRSQAIKGIYKWNSSAGSFVAVVRNGSTIEQLDGADPAMKAGESYFFNMLEETTLDYNVSPISIGGGSSNRVASPSFSPAGGTYSSPQSVTISCATSGAAIRYTTDGTTPTASSQLYISPISVSQTMTISAIGIKA
ncbi:MAG TPA: chitobiase/beta-hexosaminidase C-terminal domain-containing protein, partial [Candidatus Wallbacteria bacterium]|nr:chitobiase/beta-hexosaminidase C-terminal domain-containing protein [Candidatus Wallbacteria bacterium]